MENDLDRVKEWVRIQLEQERMNPSMRQEMGESWSKGFSLGKCVVWRLVMETLSEIVEKP